MISIHVTGYVYSTTIPCLQYFNILKKVGEDLHLHVRSSPCKVLES